MNFKLGSLEFFRECDSEQLDLLSSTLKVKNYETGDILVYEEDDLSKVYFLYEGEVKLYKVDRFDNEVFLYTLSGEALLTTLGSLDCGRVNCFSNIEFLKPSRVISFDIHLFKQVVKMQMPLLINMVNMLADQKQKHECMITMGIVYDVTAKVAKMLCEQLELYNTLKKQEISYRLNIQPATLSRVLAKFIRKDLIKEEDHRTVILKHEELSRYFKEGI